MQPHFHSGTIDIVGWLGCAWLGNCSCEYFCGNWLLFLWFCCKHWGRLQQELQTAGHYILILEKCLRLGHLTVFGREMPTSCFSIPLEAGSAVMFTVVNTGCCFRLGCLQAGWQPIESPPSKGISRKTFLLLAANKLSRSGSRLEAHAVRGHSRPIFPFLCLLFSMGSWILLWSPSASASPAYTLPSYADLLIPEPSKSWAGDWLKNGNISHHHCTIQVSMKPHAPNHHHFQGVLVGALYTTKALVCEGP